MELTDVFINIAIAIIGVSSGIALGNYFMITRRMKKYKLLIERLEALCMRLSDPNLWKRFEKLLRGLEKFVEQPED